MLAISRALMSRPRLILFDEPSLGLAPNLVELTFDIIEQIRSEGVTIVMVEQNALAALELCDHSYVLEAGEADVTLIEDEWRGIIEGKGRDTRSASLATGRVAYELTETENGEATQIAVSIAYSLAGPLAQFSRGALVRDLVSRLAGAFAQNLEARLSGRETEAAAALDAGSLMFSVVWDRIKAVFNKILRRSSD